MHSTCIYIISINCICTCNRRYILEGLHAHPTMAGLDSLIIPEVMASKGVQPYEIPEESNRRVNPRDPDSIRGSKRYFRARGFAEFNTHPGCRRKWRSAQAWAIVDLKKQKLAHLYQQSCQGCEGKASPQFGEEALERMAEWSVDEYLHRSRRVRRNTGDTRRDSLPEEYQCERPHDQERCDMCKQLGRPCTMSYRDYRDTYSDTYSDGDSSDACSTEGADCYRYDHYGDSPARTDNVHSSSSRPAAGASESTGSGAYRSNPTGFGRATATGYGVTHTYGSSPSTPTTRVDWGGTAGAAGLRVRGAKQSNYPAKNDCCVVM